MNTLIRIRSLSDIQTLSFGSSLYIRLRSAAHVLTSTKRLPIILT
jgi:hypothetical protein